MADLILHHYPNSPFSEKIRLIFGFKKLSWKSVLIPSIMPKPNLVALTGGYRRTPVLQIGADIYCDTALIAEVIERMAPTPSLYPMQTEGLARTLAQWADATLFWTVIPYVFQPAAVGELLGNLTPEQMKAFTADRAAFRGDAPRMSTADATGALAHYLRRLDHMLADGRPYLLGAEASIADFSVYHCIWFVQRAKSVAGILDEAPRLQSWMERITAFGQGTFDKLSAEEALAVARAGSGSSALPSDAPYFEPYGASLGDRVAIMPTDYGIDPVQGELVLSTADEMAVAREDAQAGRVVVHFPRIGFRLKKV